jgi:hypothetical protein
MLFAQRQRFKARGPEIQFSRLILWFHLVLGGVPAVLLLLHGMPFWGVLVVLWFLLTLGAVMGLKSGLDWARTVLGLLFLGFPMGAAILILHVYPQIPAEHPAMLPVKLLPIWVGLLGAVYLALAFVVFVDQRIRRAMSIRFELW